MGCKNSAERKKQRKVKDLGFYLSYSDKAFIKAE